MTNTRDKTRNERLLSLISCGGLTIPTLTRILDCPAASIRRSVQELRRKGYYITIYWGEVTNYGQNHWR